MMPEFENPGHVPEWTDHAKPNVPVPPAGVAVIVIDWPWSMITAVGEMDTVEVAFTVTAALVAGVDVGAGVAPPVVPVSVVVTVRTQLLVVPVGV
jgi:hypothetical protein